MRHIQYDDLCGFVFSVLLVAGSLLFDPLAVRARYPGVQPKVAGERDRGWSCFSKPGEGGS
jgi:hypothetical protein